MGRFFSDEKEAEFRSLFPEKYKEVIRKAEFHRALGFPFELTFRTHQDFNQFFLLWEKEDFPAEEFADKFSVGIMATCPQCGQLQMAGGIDLGLMELNASNIKYAFEKGGELINVCASCLVDIIGPENIGEYIEETKSQLRLIRGDKEENSGSTIH